MAICEGNRGNDYTNCNITIELCPDELPEGHPARCCAAESDWAAVRERLSRVCDTPENTEQENGGDR